MLNSQKVVERKMSISVIFGMICCDFGIYLSLQRLDSNFFSGFLVYFRVQKTFEKSSTKAAKEPNNDWIDITCFWCKYRGGIFCKFNL